MSHYWFLCCVLRRGDRRGAGGVSTIYLLCVRVPQHRFGHRQLESVRNLRPSSLKLKEARGPNNHPTDNSASARAREACISWPLTRMHQCFRADQGSDHHVGWISGLACSWDRPSDMSYPTGHGAFEKFNPGMSACSWRLWPRHSSLLMVSWLYRCAARTVSNQLGDAEHSMLSGGSETSDGIHLDTPPGSRGSGRPV